MSFALLTLAVLASGFWFSTRCYFVKFQIARQSGHRLYLSVATVGFLFLMLAYALAGIASLSSSAGVVAALTFLLSGFSTELYNKKCPNAKSKALLREWRKDDFELICARASIEFKPISISLESRKVYVGMVIDSLEPSVDKSYLTILPIFSGYRDVDTLTYKLNHRYDSVIESILNEDESVRDEFAENRMDSVIVVPRESIVSIHIFNVNLYEEVSGDNIADINNGNN